MGNREARQKDLILMAFAIQMTAFAAVIPQLILLAFVGGIITISVAITEISRRLSE